METKEQLIIICREFDKRSDEVAVYVVKRDIIPEDLFTLKLRSRYNMELEYYVCKFHPDTTDDEIIEFAEKVEFTEPYFIELG